jgi:predicted glycoside hydrolase/deacetylase ChbG (UPF0249 family)
MNSGVDLKTTNTVSDHMPGDNWRSAGESGCQSCEAPRRGILIVNADDWGRDHETTQRIAECIFCGAVSSTSAMVFMEDSERAAALAREREIDAGLHLNLTTPFSWPGTPLKLVEQQERITRYLRSNRLAPVIFHPGLVSSFRYVVTAQLDEFRRLYGVEPDRIDGHHHMHLCANVLLGKLLPAGTIARRNFSFAPGEKNWRNRAYRKIMDGRLARRHRMTDFFFSLPPLQPMSRIEKIFSLANEFTVEVETHPANPEEYDFLAGGKIFRWTGAARIKSFRAFSSVPIS